MEKTLDITDKAMGFVESLFETDLPKEFIYHNFSYTEKIVAATQEIAEHSALDQSDKEIALLAAWFHATGYTKGAENYIETSKKIAADFLKDENVSPDRIKQITDCMMATTRGTEPQNHIQEIIHDAALYSISQDDYWDVAQDLKKENEQIYQTVHSEKDWYESRIKHLVESNFVTEYGKATLELGKGKVLKNLKKKMKKHQALLDISMEKELGVSPAELKELKKKLMKVEGRPERGIETMFRLTSKNHLTLSGMADTKANIMISVNSIIMSILIGSLMQKLDNNPQLVIPTYVMLIVNLGSIIFAILSTRPNVTGGKFTREEIENNKTNLLFFGNFHKMQRPDYQWGMHRLMEDGKFLYSSLIDDIFFLGVVLGKKFRFLRISYTIFMYGIVLAVITFMISNAIYK